MESDSSAAADSDGLKDELDKLQVSITNLVSELERPPGDTRGEDADPLWTAQMRLAASLQRLALTAGMTNRYGRWFYQRLDRGVLNAFVVRTESLLRNVNAKDAFELSKKIDRYVYDTISGLAGPDAEQWLTPGLVNFANEAKRAVTLADLEESIFKSSSAVEAIADDVRQAAGVVADGELSKAFAEYAATETESANKFRALAVVGLLIVAGLAAVNLFRPPDDIASAISHIGIIASGLAISGYLARESSQHRSSAKWAQSTSVQLRTFDAFSADLLPEQRAQLRIEFGRRIFSEYPNHKDGQVGGVADHASLLQAISELVRSSRGVQ